MRNLSEAVAKAYAKSLQLEANPELRSVLTEIYVKGRASEAQLKAIPVLAGELSAKEQAAIERTIEAVEAVSRSPEIRKFLAEGQKARDEFIARQNVLGAQNNRATLATVITWGTLGVLGAIMGIVTGHPEIAISAPMGGTTGAAIATVFGYARAGEVDATIERYGVHR